MVAHVPWRLLCHLAVTPAVLWFPSALEVTPSFWYSNSQQFDGSLCKHLFPDRYPYRLVALPLSRNICFLVVAPAVWWLLLPDCRLVVVFCRRVSFLFLGTWVVSPITWTLSRCGCHFTCTATVVYPVPAGPMLVCH